MDYSELWTSLCEYIQRLSWSEIGVLLVMLGMMGKWSYTLIKYFSVTSFKLTRYLYRSIVPAPLPPPDLSEFAKRIIGHLSNPDAIWDASQMALDCGKIKVYVRDNRTVKTVNHGSNHAKDALPDLKSYEIDAINEVIQIRIEQVRERDRLARLENIPDYL